MRVEDFIQQYEAALASQNWLKVEPLFHKNACVTFSNGSIHKGIDAIQRAFSANFSLIEDEQYKMADIDWAIITNEMAVYTFKYRWSGMINGKHAAGSGIGTTTLLQENGHWKIIAEHLGNG